MHTPHTAPRCVATLTRPSAPSRLSASSGLSAFGRGLLLLSLAAIAALLPGMAAAQAVIAKEATDLPTRTEKLHRQHVLAADGTEVMTEHVVVRVLRTEALEGVKTYTIGHSASVQKLEVLEAYTLKAGGKRISVPKTNTQVNTDTGQGGGPLFSDWRRLSLTFPDLAVGDAVAVRYRLSTKEPLFPGSFSSYDTFPRYTAYDDVRISVDAPKSLGLRSAAKGLDEKRSEQGARQRIEWRFSNPRPLATERRDWSVWDIESEPYYILSTYGAHAEVAQRYVQRAAPRAAPTPRVQALAREIVGTQADRRERARLLYEWVSRTLTYGGNCVGIGAVVPREMNLVLDNRMGDCKDHATVLQALLTAQGIDSHQVLVNAGNLYQLHPLPVASQVNHVINYLPEFQVFVDATAKGLPFGTLPFQVQDKPVLAAVAGLPDRTPPDRERHEQLMETTMALRDDGGASGTVKVSLRGRFAIEMRDAFRRISRDQLQNLVKEVFAASNLQASGSVTHEDPQALLDTFSYEASFDVQRLVNASGSGGFQLAPMFIAPASIVRFVQGAMGDVGGNHASTCTAGRSEERYTLQLAPRMQLLAVPDNAGFNSRLVGYESTVTQPSPREVRVQRVLEDRTPGNVCSGETRREFRDAMAPVLEDIRQQVLYR